MENEGRKRTGMRLVKCTFAMLVLALLTCVFAPAPVHAHHNGYVCLERGKSLVIEGTLEEYVFGMPHVVLRLRLADSTVYTAEWMTQQQLANGWAIDGDTLKKGDRLIVKGTPYGCEKDKMSLLAFVRRPSDGWSWESPLYK